MVPTGGVRTLIVIKPRATPTKGEPRKGTHRKTCTVLMGYSKGSALWPAPSSMCWRVPCAERGQPRPGACLRVYVRIKGLTCMFRGLHASSTPRQTPLCPKRRPPRPQHPDFRVFRRGGLHFGHHTNQSHARTATKRGKWRHWNHDTPATRRQPASNAAKTPPRPRDRQRFGRFNLIGKIQPDQKGLNPPDWV